ncbi:phage tail tape measure protein [Desulfoluna butyratoxydans]|nr:phage tail tape measure protein [Desulfoluna butyratoxydans]
MAESVIGPLEKMKGALDEAGIASSKFGNCMAGISKKMLPFLVVANMFLSVLAPAISSAADFETKLSSLGAVSKASASEMALMKQSALDLGAKTGFAAGEVVAAQEQLSQSDFTPAQAVSVMPDILNLATAAQCDLSAAVSVSSAAMGAFNMKASESGKVADILASAAASGMSLTDLGTALEKAGNTVGKSGVSFAEFAAITNTMTGANITAANVGNATSTMFNKLTAPTGAAAKALSDLNVATKDSNGKMLPFLDIMGNMETALAGVGATEKAATLKTVFGDNALGPVNALLNEGIGNLKKFAKAADNDTGRAAEMARAKLNNLNGSLKILSAATTSFSIVVGSAFTPILKVLTDALVTVVGWLTTMAAHPIGKAVLLMAGGFSAAVVALAVFPEVMMLASMAVSFFNTMVLANPIALVAMGIIALGAVIIAFWDKVAEFFKPLTLIVQGVISVFKTLSGTIGTIEGQLAKDVQAAGLVGVITTICRVIYRIKVAWDTAWDAMVTTMAGVGSIFTPIIDTLAGAFRPLWKIITYVSRALFGAAESTSVSSWQTFGAIVGVVVGSAFQVLAWAVRLVLSPFTLCIKMVGHLFSAFVWLGEGIGNAAGWIVEHAASIGNGIKWAFLNLTPLGWIIQGFNGVKNFLSNINLAEIGVKIMHSLASGIKRAVMMPFTIIKGGFSKIRNWFSSSDDKEGSLAKLTVPGSQMVNTLSTGVRGATSVLGKGAAGAAVGVGLTLGTAMADPGQYTSGISSLPAVATPYEQAAEGASGPQHAAESGEVRSQGSKVVIEHLHVQLPDVSDADSFVQALQTLVSSYGGQD